MSGGGKSRARRAPPAASETVAPVRRESFPFKRCYLDAIRQAPATDRAALFDAVAQFALDGEEPRALPPPAAALWPLLREVLDRSRVRADAGRRGGLASSGNPHPWNAKPKGGRR